MKPKILLIAAFALVALAQLLVPYRMISYQADFALSGNEFVFKVRHSGVRYPIRGNHIWLRFEADKFVVKDKNEWENSQSVFVTFRSDSMGLAKIADVSKKKPENTENWLKAKAFLHKKDSTDRDSLRTSVLDTYKDSCYLQLTYPFHDFNIGDANPKEKERIFLDKMNNPLSNITLRVHIRENQFMVGDLTADSLSFGTWVKGVPR